MSVKCWMASVRVPKNIDPPLLLRGWAKGTHIVGDDVVGSYLLTLPRLLPSISQMIASPLSPSQHPTDLLQIFGESAIP